MITTRDLSLIRVRPVVPVTPGTATPTVPDPGPVSTTSVGSEPDAAPEDGVVVPRS